jgi:paraquat-inducible protein A
MKTPSAAAHGYALCEVCGKLGLLAGAHRCSRCMTPLHARKPGSIERAWAFLIAAYVLYVPANLLPIMHTRSLLGVQSDTILSGVAYLWSSGSWILAVIVFIASIMVPMLKMLALTILLINVQRRRGAQPLPQTRIFRALEMVGRWSMLDVYVVAILVTLVQAQSLASIEPGLGVLAFAAVVVLSMLATMAFDPRLIWDNAAQYGKENRESTATSA